MDLDGDLVLLEEEFSLYPNRNLLKATLTKTKIIVEEQDKLIDVIDLNDVIGKLLLSIFIDLSIEFMRNRVGHHSVRVQIFILCEIVKAFHFI